MGRTTRTPNFQTLVIVGYKGQFSAITEIILTSER